MRKKKKTKEAYIDDGRTIADMSEVTRPGMFGHLPGSMKNNGSESHRGFGTGERASHSQAGGREGSEQPPFTRRERRMYTFAAMKAGLLIGLVYIIGCCVVIGLLYLAWVVF